MVEVAGCEKDKKQAIVPDKRMLKMLKMLKPGEREKKKSFEKKNGRKNGEKNFWKKSRPPTRQVLFRSDDACRSYAR